MLVELRCDGDDRVGAGHVARCVRLAKALEHRGAQCRLVGHREGGARDLVERSGLAEGPPSGDALLGVGADADAVVVDSYELSQHDIEAAACERPVAAVVDGNRVPEGVTVLSYHLDAPERLRGVSGLLGPDFAPVEPAYAGARRRREGQRVLITAGGGSKGSSVLTAVVHALTRDPQLELFVATRDVPAGVRDKVPHGWERNGLLSRAKWADLAVSTAGSTPYDLCCAGVPQLLLPVADNQLQVATGLASAGAAVALDARSGVDAALIGNAWSDLAGSAAGMADVGPGLIDGYGAFRAADGLLAAFGGRDAPRVLRYRPARPSDSDRLFRWRNDPAVRAASRITTPISSEHHAKWLPAVLTNPDRTLLLAEQGGVPVASVRFDREGAEAEISVIVAPDRKGGGIGSQAIREASELYLSSRPQVARVLAQIRDRNLASKTAFKRAGYVDSGVEAPDDWVMLEYSFD